MDTLTANNIKCTVTHVLFSRDGFAICDCSTKDHIPGNSIRDVELRSEAKHFERHKRTGRENILNVSPPTDSGPKRDDRI